MDEVACFNKNKLNKKLEFGRAHQLGRIEGNFFWAGACHSVRMPDAASLSKMIFEHRQLQLFEAGSLASITTDKGYYAHDNERLLESLGVEEIGLQPP